MKISNIDKKTPEVTSIERVIYESTGETHFNNTHANSTHNLHYVVYFNDWIYEGLGGSEAVVTKTGTATCGISELGAIETLLVIGSNTYYIKKIYRRSKEMSEYIQGLNSHKYTVYPAAHRINNRNHTLT